MQLPTTKDVPFCLELNPFFPLLVMCEQAGEGAPVCHMIIFFYSGFNQRNIFLRDLPHLLNAFRVCVIIMAFLYAYITISFSLPLFSRKLLLFRLLSSGGDPAQFFSTEKI